MNRPSYNRAIADDQTQNLHVFSLLLFVLINLSCNRATDSALSSKSESNPEPSLTIADPIKESTPEAIRQSHEQKIRIIMLTGDSRTTAEAVGRRLDIEEVVAEVLPNQKAEVVKRHCSRNSV